MATAPTPTLAQGACPEGTSAAGSRPRGHPISYQISKECGWFPGASTPLRPACPAPPLSCKAPSRSPYSGIKAQWPPHQRPATWLPVPTAHLVWSAAALTRVLESQDLHGSESASSPAQARHCLGASSRPLPLPLPPCSWPPAGFGFQQGQACWAALGRAQSPCLASCSRSARRTAVGPEALVAPGPQVELPPVLRPTSLYPQKEGPCW